MIYGSATRDLGPGDRQRWAGYRKIINSKKDAAGDRGPPATWEDISVP